jgi:lactoylglutathione lyase
VGSKDCDVIPGISGIAHWALKVSHLERSLHFYRDLLGFAEMMRIHFEDGRLMLVYLRVTDTQFVELFPGGEGGHGPSDMAVCVNHICLQTTDLRATLAFLQEKGVEIWRPFKLGLDGNLQAWIKDPDGNRIEFMEMQPGNMQEAAIQRLAG